MLFSLIGFETQTCTIIYESICNIIFRCNPAYVMCICLITRSWLWCWFIEVFRDTRRTTGFIWVKVCVCQRVSGDSRTWSCINWAVLLQPPEPSSVLVGRVVTETDIHGLFILLLHYGKKEGLVNRWHHIMINAASIFDKSIRYIAWKASRRAKQSTI